MNTRIIAAVALAALTLSGLGPARSQAFGQPMQVSASAEGITTTGHGEVKVKPNIARITITVTTQSTDQAEAVRQNATRTTAVLAALRGVQIADKDIETQSYTVQPQYDYKPSPPLLTGYQVQNSVQATVRDLTKIGLVIDKATAGGASEIGGVSFDLSDRAQSQSQALSQAVIAAKRKAGVMASAAGVDLGRLLTMTEGSTEPVIRPVYAMRSLKVADTSAETPVNDQQITISADATLVYAMGAAK
ncbi:MAG: SIMPL domain-containing protein [Janthinobacterium lividum]